MKKKTVKIISSLVIIAIMLMSMSTFIFAADYLDPGSITPQDTPAATSVQNMAGQILSIVQIVAVSVAIIMLIVLAIKYISASPEGKASIKQSAVLYVVGAVLLFGASGVLEIVKQFAETLGSTGK